MDLSALIFTGLGGDGSISRRRKFEPQCLIQDFDQYYDVVLLTYDHQLINEEIQKALDGFFKLEDNWDGYGAVKPSKNVLIQVSNLLAALPNQYVENLTTDNIYPNPNGTVTIEWTNDESEIVSIEVGDRNSTYYSKFHNTPLYTNNDIGLLKKGTLPLDLLENLGVLNS